MNFFTILIYCLKEIIFKLVKNYKMKKLLLLLVFFSAKLYAQKKYEVAQIKTPYGEILVWLYNETPKHKASFIQLAKVGYWDSLTFNRVIPNFVIQGGCPDTEAGFKDTTYLLNPEFVPTLKHDYGTFAAGRDDNPGMVSARCQFYIVQNKKGLPRLDNNYTVYGKVIKGMGVVDSIANAPKDKTDTPLTPITMDVNIIKVKAKKLKQMGVVVN
jgi:peptidyl-prolyl cis-trans isomerase B (cyclophilin B)